MPTKPHGSQIRRLREAKGWTSQDLARAAGIHPGFMSKIENEVLNGSPKTRLAIANALGVPLGEITYFAEPQPRRSKAAA
jgi:transcriptional regulator with XRE-family HTH domain